MFHDAFIKPAAFGTVLKIYDFVSDMEHYLVPKDPITLHFDNGIHIMTATTQFHWYRKVAAEEVVHHEIQLENILKLIIKEINSEILSLEKFEPTKKKKETVLEKYNEIKKFIKKNCSRLPQNSLLQLHFDNTIEIIKFSENNVDGASDAQLKSVGKKVKRILKKEVAAIEDFLAELAVSETESDKTDSSD